MQVTPFLDSDVRLGRAIALIGAGAGKYPYATSMLVHGSDEVVLIDPSLEVVERGGAPLTVDRMMVSHAHEDHLAGVGVFPDATICAHSDDLLGLHSLDGLMAVYGMPAQVQTTWRRQVEMDFHYTPRPDATAFEDGHAFDLGGGLRIEVVHLPGHTRGHCGFLVEPDGVFYVADIDLTGFGPYYGDHWSDLEDFERSIARCRTIDAAHYVTSHHKGIFSDRGEFVGQLDTFGAAIGRRDTNLLAYLAEPRTIDDVVAHGFIYRPENKPMFAEHVERTSMSMHLRRLLRSGGVVELEPGRFRAA